MPHCITLALCIYFTNILHYLWYIMEKIKVGDLYLGDLMMNQKKY